MIPGLDGTYLYSDNCLGDIYSATEDGRGGWTTAAQVRGFDVSGFGEDEAGELYLVDLGGKVYRIDPAPYPSPVADEPRRRPRSSPAIRASR